MPCRGRIPCRHCQRSRSSLRMRRGLCRACYADPAVRRQYHQTGTLAGLEGQSTRERDTPAILPLAVAPTRAEPGSSAKVAVLAERRRCGLSLFHPQDASLPFGRPTSHREHLFRRLRALANALRTQAPELHQQLQGMVDG